MNTAERHANEPIRLLPGLGRFFGNPTLETLGPINLDKHHPRDHEFLRRLEVLAPRDPEILQRVIMIRTKLANNIKITNKEADELINTLRAKHFSTDLNLSGHQFSTLEMDRAVIKGDLDLSNVSVNGDSNQEGMVVEGDSDQAGMNIGGNNNQNRMEVGRDRKLEEAGYLCQERMKVGGNSRQKGMKVGFLDQEGMEVEGDSDQSGMEVEGDIVQGRMEVGGSWIDKDGKNCHRRSEGAAALF